MVEIVLTIFVTVCQALQVFNKNISIKIGFVNIFNSNEILLVIFCEVIT
jgi:hypothetical protein